LTRAYGKIVGMQAPDEYVLTLSCPDRPGIVHAVAAYLVDRDCNILDSQQYGDPLDGRFFMRVHVQPMSPGTSLEELGAGFAPLAERLDMTWRLVDGQAPVRTLVLVSKAAHCLNDLLFRQSTGDLPIEVPAVVGNHRDLERLTRSYDVPFHHVPVTADTRPAAEDRLMELVAELDIDLVVLARYMQVLSDAVCVQLSGRAINIHHSFLPSFKGAKPYHQAHERGVKLIGATAHYVTAALDEGPIIEQDVTRVGHSLTPPQLVRAGQDVEAQVLSRAVRWHAESRVLLNGSRTVVFA
jgi:formyltetrahydrofolate deformylase